MYNLRCTIVFTRMYNNVVHPLYAQVVVLLCRLQQSHVLGVFTWTSLAFSLVKRTAVLEYRCGQNITGHTTSWEKIWGKLYTT